MCTSGCKWQLCERSLINGCCRSCVILLAAAAAAAAAAAVIAACSLP